MEPDTTVNLSMEQYQYLLSAVSSRRRGSFASSSLTYDGVKDPEILESFLTAASAYKTEENISDEEAVLTLPLILKDDAAIWWIGVRDEISTWVEFENRIRHAFAPQPKKPPHVIYNDIFSVKQDSEPTETFIANKRELFAQLPAPAHTVTQQLDMIYGLLSLRIREKIPRESFTTYEGLLKAAKGVEMLNADNNPVLPQTQIAKTGKKRKRCGYCRIPGHTADVCRRKAKNEAGTSSQCADIASVSQAEKTYTVGTQAPSPTAPKYSCHGCGAPGFYTANCPTCRHKIHKVDTDHIKFWTLSNALDIRARPTIIIGVDQIKDTAYIDSCANSSIASFKLYQQLKLLGYKFLERKTTVTLGDGASKEQIILTGVVPVHVCNRVITTRFTVLPESRENHTLLGVDFIQDAGMVLNLPQMKWYFIDEPKTLFDLQQENS